MSSPYRAPSPTEASPPDSTPRDLLGPRLHFAGTTGYSRSYKIALWSVGLGAWALLGTLAIAIPESRRTVAIILGIMTPVLVIAGWQPRVVSVALHQGGVVAGTPAAQQTMLWSNVRWLFYLPLEVGGDLLRRERNAGFRLVSEDDRTIVIPPGLLDPERVGWLERRVSTPLVADATQAFRRGEHLVFGDVTLHRDGVTFRGRCLSWEEVRDVQVVGSIRIRQRDAITPFATVKIEDIPHPMVFLAVLRERAAVS